MFRYHRWATVTLIDHLKQLPPARLNDTVPGTMGTIHDTMTHLVGAERIYLALMHDQPRPPRLDDTLTLDDLRREFESLSKQWDEILDHVDDYDPTLHRAHDDEVVPHVRDLLITQTLHHGNDHRTHICTVLGATGQDVPEMDEWAYWFSADH